VVRRKKLLLPHRLPLLKLRLLPLLHRPLLLLTLLLLRPPLLLLLLPPKKRSSNLL